MVEFKHTDYTTAKGVLVFPDHYVSVAHTFKKDDAAAVTQDGRKIVKVHPVPQQRCQRHRYRLGRL